MSQLEVAKVLRTTDRFWSYLETGIRKPSEQTLYVIEKELGISKEWLTSGSGVIFSNPEKGLNVLQNKTNFEVEEIYFLLHQMLNIYVVVSFVMFENKGIPIKKEYCLSLLDIVKNLEYKNNKYDEDFEQIEKFIESNNYGTSIQCVKIVKYLSNYILERNFLLTQNEIDLFNLKIFY